MKIGRNEPCPCGSGKKYKRCCYQKIIKLDDETGILAEVLDIGQKKLFVLTDNILENQIKRESLKIAESFDKLYDPKIKEISSELSKAMVPFFTHLEEIVKEKWRLTCSKIILNIFNTISSAIFLLRVGYRLQPGILIRNIFEALSVVLALIQDKKYYDEYISGKFDSTKAISIAKKAFPFIGPLYGMFSNHFAHIGELHASFNPPVLYKNDEEAALLNLSMISMATNMIYITVELLCYPFISEPRYWKRLGSGKYQYSPSAKEKTWQSNFLMSNAIK